MEAKAHAHKEFGPLQYVIVWGALLVLTAITVAVWKTHWSLGTRVTVALSVATVKAGLVALFFMHLWEHGGVNRLVMATSLLFVALLIGLVIADNATRFEYANPPYSSSWTRAPFEDAAPPLQEQPPPVEGVPEAAPH
ncbi:MAG TPA: cytochrome C oxidase subunit IV family protein [Anaeromyxobacteraceae bacterium]|nr:cytochrome C oxidase subunit IV family protein [Anaeromyxobacteraceae bacterium]